MTVGFTAGIAVIIFASQLSELFGLSLDGKEPGELIPKLKALAAAWGTFDRTRRLSSRSSPSPSSPD